MKRILFGLDVPVSSAGGADPVAEARRAEELGFDFVSCSDHPSGESPTYEAWTLLAWIAASTARIGVMSRVLGVPFRSPAMLAKMAESLDRLSGGRLLLGLGAGASTDELRAFGLPAASAGERVTGLAEAVRILQGLWGERRFSYEGDVYHVVDAPFEPKPERRIPVWLGTFKERGLAVTGQLADGWIPSLDYAGADRLGSLRARVLEAAEEAGRLPGDVTCALNLELRLADRVDPDDGKVVGPPPAVAERLVALAAEGFDAFNLKVYGPRNREQFELLAAEVLPAVTQNA